MSKYYDEQSKVRLSTYLKSDSLDKGTISYLISCLGDVLLSEDIIYAYYTCLHSYGGRYDVRREAETVKGLYEFYKKFPWITKKEFGEISFRYIKDLFEKYELDKVYEKLIKVYGRTDEALEIFIIYIEKKADELQEQYEKDALRLDEFRDEYHVDDYAECFQFIYRLKGLVTRKHIPVDLVIDSLPSSKLVKEDMEHFMMIQKQTHCYMCMDYPVSYLMTTSLIKKEDLSKYGERPTYYVDVRDLMIDATFTTKEFIDSVKKEKEKRLIRKK